MRRPTAFQSITILGCDFGVDTLYLYKHKISLLRFNTAAYV